MSIEEIEKGIRYYEKKKMLLTLNYISLFNENKDIDIETCDLTIKEINEIVKNDEKLNNDTIVQIIDTINVIKDYIKKLSIKT